MSSSGWVITESSSSVLRPSGLQRRLEEVDDVQARRYYPHSTREHTTAPSRPSDAPAPHGRVVNGRGRSRRPHVFPLVFGLIDARVGRQGEFTGIVMVKTGRQGLSDSLDGVDPRGPDGFGEGCEVALVLLGVAL